MKAFLSVVLLILLLIVTILVGAQNDQLITVNYLIAQSTLRLSVLMAVMFLLGVIISAAMFFLFWLRLTLRIQNLERRQKSLSGNQAQ